MKKVALGIYLPADVARALRVRAAELGIPVSTLVETSIVKTLKKGGHNDKRNSGRTARAGR